MGQSWMEWGRVGWDGVWQDGAGLGGVGAGQGCVWQSRMGSRV